LCIHEYISTNRARARERYWYEQLGGSLNNKIPNRSQKEYRDKYNKNNIIKTIKNIFKNMINQRKEKNI